MINPNPDMLLHIGIGDAYCLATEYVKLPKHQKLVDECLKFRKYHRHPRYSGLPAGTYSDDTEMSVGNAEVLLEMNLLDDIGLIDFANKWVDVFQRTRRPGYSAGFQQILNTVNNGKELIENLIPISDKNGAAMRSVPLGILPTPRDVLLIAKLQAKITHDTFGGILSSQAVALMSHFVLHYDLRLSKRELGNFLLDYLPEFEEYTKPIKERVIGPNVGLKTAQAVFNLITSCDSLLEVIRETIKLGGDTDSVGAISCGIASAKLKNDLPDFMEYGLEPNSKYGAAFLKALGSQLMSKI